MRIGYCMGALLVWMMSSCQKEMRWRYEDAFPEVFPDYVGVTIPESMAGNDAEMFPLAMRDGRQCDISRKRNGDTVWVTVRAWRKGDREGVEYKRFPIYVSHDSIDPYVAYRLIEPGYESWSDISICQRELASFEETPIVTNKVNGRGCINCHSFAQGNPGRMLFHSRSARNGGTFLLKDGKWECINFSEKGSGKPATYPAWHPSGKYVAFSSNDTHQCFHMAGNQPIEVYDNSSDIILYDVEKKRVLEPPVLNRKDKWATFPAWNALGDTLYYCETDSISHPSTNRSRIHYRLMKIGFDAVAGTFAGNPVEVGLAGLDRNAHSVSFPRVMGDYLMFTLTDYGTFPIWHDEADLWLLNLRTGKVEACESLNSHSAESYHSWSSNGKWVVYGSRRQDGRYTQLYFSHFDGHGGFSKPFLLPQRRVEDNALRLKSYNIPEFVKSKVKEIKKL